MQGCQEAMAESLGLGDSCQYQVGTVNFININVYYVQYSISIIQAVTQLHKFLGMVSFTQH